MIDSFQPMYKHVQNLPLVCLRTCCSLSIWYLKIHSTAGQAIKTFLSNHMYWPLQAKRNMLPGKVAAAGCVAEGKYVTLQVQDSAHGHLPSRMKNQTVEMLVGCRLYTNCSI